MKNFLRPGTLQSRAQARPGLSLGRSLLFLPLALTATHAAALFAGIYEFPPVETTVTPAPADPLPPWRTALALASFAAAVILAIPPLRWLDHYAARLLLQMFRAASHRQTSNPQHTPEETNL